MKCYFVGRCRKCLKTIYSKYTSPEYGLFKTVCHSCQQDNKVF